MSRENFQLSGNAADIYEAQKVPAMFGPLAEATLDLVPLDSDDAILDVACGTGILAREARQRVGPEARIAGADLNESMISTARKLTDPPSRSCEWHVAGVEDMPFGDNEFSKVFCQQGFQFFPEEIAALREMRRVLRTGGLLAITIWSGPSPLFSAMAKALGEYVDNQTAQKSLAPFSYKGREVLKNRLSECGFSDISRQKIALNRVVKNTESAIRNEIMGNPVGAIVEKRGKEIMQRIVEQILNGVAQYRDGSNLVVPQHTHLFQARAK